MSLRVILSKINETKAFAPLLSTEGVPPVMNLHNTEKKHKEEMAQIWLRQQLFRIINTERYLLLFS